MIINADVNFIHTTVTLSTSNPVKDNKGLTSATCFKLKDGENEIGQCVFAPFPGCCGAVISTETIIHPKYRKLGYAREFHMLKAKLAHRLGYSLLVATTQLSNLPEVIGASKQRWKFVKTFKNKRTGNELGLMVKDV